MTSPDLTNVVWVKNNIDQHEYPKELQAYPDKKGEIPDTRNTRWFWKKIGYGLGIAKKYRVGSGIVYPSGTAEEYFEYVETVVEDEPIQSSQTAREI